MQDMVPEWNKIAAGNRLQPLPLSSLASACHADLYLGRPMECVHSTAQSRALGFNDLQDSEQSYIDVFDPAQAERIIP